MNGPRVDGARVVVNGADENVVAQKRDRRFQSGVRVRRAVGRPHERVDQLARGSHGVDLQGPALQSAFVDVPQGVGVDVLEDGAGHTVDGTDGDGDDDGIRLQFAVGGPIRERVAAGEIDAGQVLERPVAVEGQFALGGPRDQQCREPVVVRVGVVGEHAAGRIDRQSSLLKGVVRVGNPRRRMIDCMGTR